jgi:hypothetical protein
MIACVTLSTAVIHRSLSVLTSRLSGLFLVAIALLLGCSSVKLGYNNLDEVAYWWLDGYVDFDSGQRQRAREDLGTLHRWHRANELGRFENLLQDFERIATGDITQEKACSFAPVIRGGLRAVADQAEPALVTLALSMSPDQLRHLEGKYSRNTAKFRREWIEVTPVELLDKRYKTALERSERVYGRLGAEQRTVLREQLQQTVFDPQRSLADRQRRQRETLGALRKIAEHRGSMAEARKEVRATLDRLLAPPAAQAAYNESLVQENCRVLAALHNSTTPAQRETAVARLRGWQRDLQELAGSTTKPQP